MRQALKKLTALLLSIAMVLSLFTDILPAAYADEGGVSTPTTGTEVEKDYDDIVTTWQPGLYVDFLGDNRNYLPQGSTVDAHGVAAPGGEDQNAETNPKVENTRNWKGYLRTEADENGSYEDQNVIFWVGVGIDKMDELDLFTQGSDGIYSLELGFYYNSTFIEPYTGLTGDHTDKEVQEAYEQVIADANLKNYDQYRWEDFRIVSAETGLRPQTDVVTQEVIAGPDMDTILSSDDDDELVQNNWRMTYVAIERDPNVPGAKNRPFTSSDPEAPENQKTKYLLIIPFRLKAFDPRYQSRLCLRLARNAGMFSIGGGEDGSSPYAAWERVTTRNPGRELKLMANFRGDLNIFNGKRVRDELYNATLVLDNGGGTDNTAVLSVDGDPSQNGVSVNEDGQKILNLPGGTGMKVDVTLQTGYEVTVRVYPEADKSKPEDQRTYFPCGEVWDNDKGTYTFVMPNIDVIVEVIFGIKDNIEFNLYLDEVHTGEDPVVKPDGKVEGNGTVLTAEYPGNPVPPAPRDPETVTVDKYSPRDNSLNLPREKVKVEKSITGINTSLTVDVALHADYYAEVEIYNVANKQTVLPTSWTGEGISVISGSNRMMVPYGGQLILDAMRQSDMIVRVRYLPAQRVTAKLEVWHENTAPKDTNVAQLRTMGYDDNNEGMYAYSGVVYDNDKVVPEDHSAVKAPFRVLPMVEAQAALLSGSLGGDGNTPVPWLESIPDGAALPQPDPDSILALLYRANTPADYANKLHAYDLRNLTGLTKGPGLRKNAKGEFYTDSEMTQAYQRLLEIQALAKKELQDMADAGASTTPSGVEKVDVTGPDPADSTKTKLLFSYYKLTPDQVQAYLLDYERDQEEQEQYQKDLAQYNEDYQKYLDDVAAGVTPAPTPPTPPTAPAPLALRTDADAFVELAKYTWYDPSENHDTRPPTGLTPPPGHTIETRVGRRTAVLLESNSAYTVVGSVEILDANDRTTVLSTATRDPDHQNVYLFDMPDKDCIVKVTYKEREAHKLSLSVAVINGKDEPGNVTTVTAFAPDPDHPTAKKVILKEYRDNHTVSTDSVLEDSVVTVLVNKIPGYTVSASVVQGVLQTPVGTSPSSTTNMADGTVFTFRMPSQEAEIRITYTRDVRTNNANLLLEGERTGATGYWDGTANEMIKKSVPEGEKLKAYINVAPGYYIVSAEAYTGKGAYPFTMSGNGWNNGQGGRVELTTLMPDEEYFVRVTLARYTPPEEGTMALTLQVMDPDNEKTGMPAAYDDNNATARASGGLTLGPVGLAYGEFPTPSGSNVVVGSAEPASGWVRAGETVTVEYELQTGYVLDSIVVEPAGLGVVPTFVRGADNRVRAQFTMPAASATVVVTFRKSEKAARLFLNLNKTEDGVPATKDTQADAGNTVTWVKSETFDRNSSLLVPGTSEHRYNLTGGIPTTVPALDSAVTTGVALPGEWVTLNVRTAPGWYVHSVTVTDRLGIRQNYTPGTDGTENTITFYMPSSDANVLINYRRGTAPDPTDPDDPRNSDRLLELLVLDPDNLGTGDTPVYDDNWAGAKITGAAAAAPIGPLGKARAAVRDSRYVKPGDLVTVEYSPTADYALDIITVTAGGETLIPTYTVVPTFAAPGRATFLMPDANTTVVVRFRAVTEDDPAHRYTANLVLHPSGDDSVGVGTFDHDLNNRFYSRTALPGETIDFTAWAKDGYYIKRITVTPAVLGVSADYSGAFGLQNGSFVMPAADVQVNVFFEKLDPGKEWPQEVPYSVSLEVYDATGKGGKAHFGTIAGNALVSPDSADVGSGARKTLWDYAQGGTRVSIHERDRVFVSLEPAADTYVRSVTVTDSRGKSVPWSYVPGGIAFDMTPAHVTVTVHYAQRTTGIDEGRKHKVTLHVEGATGADEVRLERNASDFLTEKENGQSIDGLFAGDTLTLTATPDLAAVPYYHSVVSAYVVVDDGSGGSPVVIPTTGLLPGGAGNTTQNGMPLVAAGGQVRFAMPDADAAVYVKFLDQGIPKPDELTASLMVMGPVGSGSAIMTAAAGSGPILPPGTLPNTGAVDASGGGALFAPQRTKLTVDLTVNPGYAISSIRAVDFQGNDVPYTWTYKDGKVQPQFTLTMPDVEGVRVYVELEEVVDPNRELTAQVVVNNGGGSGNTAKLRRGGTAGSGVAILNPVHPGEEIYLDLTVQPGYRVASIRVVPAKFGIAPSLTDKDTKNQTTSFTMPGEDVVVYVHFASDGRTRRTATLVTTGQYHENNRAKIHSDFSGWSDEVSPKPSTYTNNKDTTSVMAAPATATESAEWVTVNYTWDEFNVVDYVTVTYTNGVTTVPFTQNKDLSARKGEITFPMVDANVIVTVHYKKGSELTTYEAVLHVIDMDDNTEITDVSWARLTWGSETTRDPVTGDLKAGYPFPGNVRSIQVPAGQTVTVDADTVSPGVYLWAGYVIYRAGGQMIRFEFDPDDPTDPKSSFSGYKKDTFVMHPGRNDVYVYFTKIKPEETDYSAVLMLDSPAADKKSTAKIETDGDPNQTGTVTANTDPDHAYIVATAGDTITVSVKPDAGYAVESILMTPLGVSDAAGIPIVPTQAGNNYSFTMPAQNVAIRVKLKIDSAGKYVATLHYNSADKGDGYVPLPDEVAWAILGYDTSSVNTDGGQLLVDENKQMDLSVCLNDGYLVLAAYVLQPDGTMVSLSDSLEGTTDVNKGKYDVDKAVNFRMPASDVDVYVWFTKTAPDIIWRTAVLTVTDNDGAGTVNSGLNTARFWTDTHPQATEMQIVTSGGVPTHGFFWVKEGEKVTVKIDLPYSGYVFNHPATISHSVTSAGTPTLLEDPGNAPEYVYTYNVGNCNSAVHAHFVASSITQNPLDVVVIDPDNPGGDQNTLEVSPGILPKLTLVSSSSAGARQRVPGVTSGATVDFVITPQPGYKTVAYLVSGNVRRQLTLTGNTGSFSMPDAPATLEVTLVKEDRAYSATLSILDTQSPVTVTTDVSTAHMTEDAFQGRVSASTGPAAPPATGTEKGTFPVLPNGTGLTASVDILGTNRRIIGGVLITNQGSQALPATTNAATSVDEYKHTLNGRDAELRILVEPEPVDRNDRTYIASVTAVRLPSGTNAPTIAADPVNSLSGSSWTAAKKGNGITVTLDVPYGYRADLTVDGADVTLSETSIDATDVTAGITGRTVKFNAPKMPDRNVVVTVTYVKTRFTATITTGGNGSGKADLTATPTGGSTQKVNATGTIGDLKGGEALDFTATPDEGSEITRILMTTASGTTSFPAWDAAGAGSEAMPAEDVTITVIFGKKRASSHYLDLHVSGVEGGTATLAATTGTPASVTSRPSDPHGFSRIQAVEAGSGVTLTVTPEPGYHVTLGYYLHNGSTLTYVTTPADISAGGTATFTMPDTSTCIYVTFRAGEDPDPNDPNKYLDLHVSGTGGGSATLTAAGVGTVSSTPTNPHSVSTLRPVGADVEVTLDVKPEPGYTAMVSYYVYNGGTPEPTVLTAIPLTGGVAKFPMPTESTCVYVTFRGPDQLPYLDLHVTNPRGGEATLATDGFGTLSSTPADPKTYSRIDQVEAGTPVKLTVTPGADYTVSVSYYRHDGGNLYYESYLIDTGNGGTASFDMPNTATCIYVAFHGPGEEPEPDPDDPEKYLDLHVAQTQGGSVTLAPDGDTPMASDPTAPRAFDQRKPVAAGTNVTLTVTPLPGYTASVSYYVHNSGGPVTVTGTIDSATGGTVTFPMPAQSTCVYVTFKRDPNDPRKYLDLHVSGLANGSASLTADGVGTVSSTPAAPVSVSTLQPVPENTNVTLNVTPEPGYAVTVSYYVHNGGGFAYTSNTVDNVLGGTATFLMPSESTCIYVHFHRPTDPEPDPDPPDPPDPPEPELHIAYVTVVGADGEPLNAAQSIVDTTTSGLGGGTLWAYGVAGDVMKTFFTVAPGYKAKVTARRLDTNTLVTVGQQGTTGSATATSTMPAMPDADMEVIITYYRDTDPPVSPHTLTLRLVGHDGRAGNMATLKGGAADLTLAGTAAPSGANVTVSTTAELGDRLDLDANRESNYTMWATLEYTDSNGAPCVVNLPLNEYGTNGTCLLFMPDADAVVTVYYRLPYKATLFVIDAQGKDFENGGIGDTAGASAAGVVPKSTLAVTDSAGILVGDTTQTHTPITDLTGKENTATTVDLTTLPDKTAIASVIATTSSGTVNLTETAAGSGVYPFPMSTPTRAASDVDITVVLRDTTKPDPMYIATVYKVGHDNQPGNGATITNTTEPTLPAGTIWSGAYGTNAMEVTVTTAPGYYAVVTAVRTGTAIPVPVLQMTATGPFPATFTMPAANVDVTVTYTKTPPEAPLKLVLKGHDQKGANSAYVNDADTHILIPTLTLSGAGAASTADLQKASDSPVKAGTNLEVLTGAAPGYHVESITLTVPGLAPITLPLSAVSSAATTMPVVTGGGQAVITVTIAPGQKSPRPFDPTHSTIYMAASQYPVDPTPTDPGNPNLSSPDQEGWILADNQSATTPGTFVVTIPTLYDKPEPDKKDTLHDAAEGNELDKRPTYIFYWKDDAGKDHPLVVGTDISVEKEEVLLPANNPSGSYPAGSTHYGYQVTLKSLIANSKLSTYLEEGGTIYVTATCTHTTADGTNWVESDQTQVILQPAKTYTATLWIVDVSSAQDNKVELTVDGDTGNAKFGVADADGEKLEGLTGKEKLRTKVTPGDQVKVVSVLAIPSEGSPVYLSPDALLGGDYPYTMDKKDVDIVVTLSNEGERLHTATVVKVDGDAKPENTVAISNPTHPVLNRDRNDPARWTAAYTGDEIRVDITAGPEYLVTVSAVGKDSGNPLAVSQAVGGGTMVVTLPDKMPDENVEITVTFTKLDPADSWITLRVRMDNGSLPVDPGNRAAAAGTDAAPAALTLTANAANGYTETQRRTGAAALDLNTALAPGYAIRRVELTVDGGAPVNLGTGLAIPGIGVPAGNAVITVILEETAPAANQTPRPFDPAHAAKYGGDPTYEGQPHQEGYLLAENLGGSRVRITVPNLYDGDLHDAQNVVYKLYARIGGVMTPLVEGGDYDVVYPAVDYTHTLGADDWTGQYFTIQCLDPTGALGDYVKNGGVIYITATDVVTPKDESAFTEVIIPADPNRDDPSKNYTATLEIIDETGLPGNGAAMQDANSGRTVNTDGAVIPNLVGGEIIRTQVTKNPAAAYTVMAHSPSMGNVLLFADPTGTDRYLRDMPNENMTVTVHFRAESDHLHIAAVQKRGATAVPGNNASILNKTDNDDNGFLDLNHGDIWTEGRCDQLGAGATADRIQVHVETAPGFYATVTMTYIDPTTGDEKTDTLIVQGVGDGKAFDVGFDMPHADVQVVVLFEAGQKSPRPYDPKHSEKYYGDIYQHNGDDDQSTTHEDGWLLGENLGGGKADVTIPTLWKTDMENANNAKFAFYLKDETTGNYTLLKEGVDYTLTHPDADKGATGFETVSSTYTYYTDPTDTTSPTKTETFTGVRFILNEVPTGKLKDLLDSGLSLYVTALKQSASVLPWLESEMTELVIPSTGLRPHDPDRVNPEGTVDPTYEDHWIRAENRGDYLIVTVPQLNSPRGDKATSADDALHRFRLHLEVKKADGATEIVDVTDLLTITNVRGYDHPTNVNTLYDPDWDPKVDGAGNPRTPDQWEEYYENEVYNTTSLDADKKPYNGARFIVEINEKAADPNGLIPILKKIFDNDGTMNGTASNYRMYITSDVTDKTDDPVPDFRAMDYVDFEVPRYYRLNGMLESYAPTHIATVSLFRYDDTTGEAESTPAFAHRQFRSSGTGLWTLDFTVKSSELMGADRSGVDYQFVARKPGHVTFTWDHVELKPDNLDPREPDQVTFTVAAVDETGNVVYEDAPANTLIQAGVIALFGGDVTGDDNVWMDDNSLIVKYLRGRVDWSTDTQDTDPDWAISVYNPESVAYRIDLNGDGYITVRDSDIWDKERNFNKNTTDYVMPQLRTSSPTIIAVMSLELLLAPEAYAVEKDTEIIKPIEPTPEGPDTYTVEEDTTVIHPVEPTPEDPAPDDSAGSDDPMGPPPAAPDAYTVDRDTTLVAPTPSGDSLASVPLSGKAAGDRLAIIPPRYDETEESSQKRE